MSGLFQFSLWVVFGWLLYACVAVMVEDYRAEKAHREFFEHRVVDRVAGADPNILSKPRPAVMSPHEWATRAAAVCMRRGVDRNTCLRHANHATACIARVIHTGLGHWEYCKEQVRWRIENSAWVVAQMESR